MFVTGHLLDLTGNNMAMAKRPIDRRVARTRAMLQKAHISLILERATRRSLSRTSARPPMSVDQRSTPTTRARMI